MVSQTLKGTTDMKVVLKSSTQALKEVVVTGLTRTDRRLFTGATDKVDADKARLSGVADISRSLEGQAAGVSVQNVSGTFGTSPKIRIRGATSIYGSSKPLWVVDGVIMEDAANVGADDLASGNPETLISSAIAGLNADDIESFQILKDGSATVQSTGQRLWQGSSSSRRRRVTRVAAPSPTQGSSPRASCPATATTIS